MSQICFRTDATWCDLSLRDCSSLTHLNHFICMKNPAAINNVTHIIHHSSLRDMPPPLPSSVALRATPQTWDWKWSWNFQLPLRPCNSSGSCQPFFSQLKDVCHQKRKVSALISTHVWKTDSMVKGILHFFFFLLCGIASPFSASCIEACESS